MTINTVIIKLLLAELDMTQAELAEKCGMLPQNVSTVLTRGTASPRTVGGVANLVFKSAISTIKEG